MPSYFRQHLLCQLQRLHYQVLPYLINESVAKAASVTHVTTSPTRVSVHDPSITKSSDGTYYVYGSHTAAAKSTDLVNWTKLSNDLNAGDSTSATNNFVFGNMPENLKKPFKWAGDHDEDASFYNVWAPDVFWNPDYINTDGTKGAYMNLLLHKFNSSSFSHCFWCLTEH